MDIAEVEELDSATEVEELVLRVVRTVLRELFEHEMDEMLCRDGRQIRDPHAAQTMRLVLR